MAMSERSQHIWNLWNQLGNTAPPGEKAVLRAALREALLELIDKQAPQAAKHATVSAGQLKAELLESLDGDVLWLCEELSEQKSARDVVNERLAELATVYPDSRTYDRDEDNARLAQLLRAYRAAGQAKREADALFYKALVSKMRQIAEYLAHRYGLPPECAEVAIDLVVDKWLSDGGLLHGWREDGGAAVSTWLFKRLNWRMRDLRRKAQRHGDRVVYENALGGDEEEGSETGSMDRFPSDSRGKTVSSLLRKSELSTRFQALIREIPGKHVNVIDKDGNPGKELLTEDHARLLEKWLEHDKPTDAQLAKILGADVSKIKAWRWKKTVFAYIAQHPSSGELMELMQPCG